MPFTIPNSSATYDGKQSEPDRVDIDTLVKAFNAGGVISGASATATTSSLVVSLSSGIVLFAGTKITIASGSVTASSGDATNPRFDLLTAATSGAYALVQGTASSAPVFPTPGSTVIVLGALYVPAAATVASSSQVVDKRVIMAETGFEIPTGRFKASGTTVYYTIPGVGVTSQSTLALVTAADYFFPMLVSSTVTIDRLAAEVETAAGAVGVTFRMGLYRADTDWQPTALLLDSGTIGATSAGIRTYSPAATVLSPGRYLGVMAASSTPTMRTALGSVPGGAYLDTLGATMSITQFRNGRAYAAFPDPGTAWNAVTNAASNPVNMVFLRISVP